MELVINFSGNEYFQGHHLCTQLVSTVQLSAGQVFQENNAPAARPAQITCALLAAPAYLQHGLRNKETAELNSKVQRVNLSKHTTAFVLSAQRQFCSLTPEMAPAPCAARAV